MHPVLKRNSVNIIGNGRQIIVDAFTDNYKIVLFDYTGSGQSDLSKYIPVKYQSLNGYVQDLVEICEALDLKGAIFVGHSVSSMIGLLAANQHPEYFSKLVFIGPSPRYLNADNYIGGFEQKDLEGLFEFMDNNYLGWSSVMAPAIMGNADRPELGEFLTSSFCSTDPDIARDFARVTFFSDNRADLSNLSVKSLTIQCSEDIIAPFAVGDYVHTNTPGNEFILLKATGHCPHISEPWETAEAIKSFIEKN